MSRSLSFIGLNQRALDFIKNNSFKGRTDLIISEEFFPESLENLLAWEDPKDNSLYYEVVQDIVWSSGPIVFTTIHSLSKPRVIYEVSWKVEEMNLYI